MMAHSIAKRVSANNGLSYQCPVTKKISASDGRACFTPVARVKIGFCCLARYRIWPTIMDNCLSPSGRLLLLQRRHRALDDEITQLSENPWQNQLLLRRLKKEKLMLRDTIERLKSGLIPDMDA